MHTARVQLAMRVNTCGGRTLLWWELQGRQDHRQTLGGCSQALLLTHASPHMPSQYLQQSGSHTIIT